MILFCKIKFQQGRKRIAEIFSSGCSNNEERRRKVGAKERNIACSLKNTNNTYEYEK